MNQLPKNTYRNNDLCDTENFFEIFLKFHQNMPILLMRVEIFRNNFCNWRLLWL